MKHSGKARKAAFKLIIFSFVAGFVIWVLLFVGSIAAAVLAGAGLVLAPGHGKVDAIDAATEPLFMGGEVQRVSIFLSVIDVHVQNAPVSGKVAFFKYTSGQFLSALKTES